MQVAQFRIFVKVNLGQKLVDDLANHSIQLDDDIVSSVWKHTAG